MLTRDEARELARRHIADMAGRSGKPEDEYVLLDRATREDEFGWVFFYNNRAYVETGDPLQGLAGNSPIIVDRNGRLSHTGTVHRVEHYMDAYRERWRSERHAG